MLASKNVRKLLKYVFFGLLVVWGLLTILLAYQYALFSSQSGAGKGGTIVEGIIEPISYIPYQTSNKDHHFYQSFLFDSCIDFSVGEERISYSENICSISTEDNQTYYVTVKSGSVRSDGVPVTNDDIFFTYNDIIKKNKRSLPTVDLYNTIQVTQTTDGFIKVIFDFPSVDNGGFFTNFILPKHVVDTLTLDQYRTLFSTNPVTSSCGAVKTATSDTYSLVFDLNGCDDTSLAYYQLKYFETQQAFDQYIQTDDESIISLYTEPVSYSDYEEIDALSTEYMTVFFNTESAQLSKRINRALGGLLTYATFTGTYEDIFFKDHLVFDAFWSTGAYLEEYLLTNNPRLDFDKQGLDRIDIDTLPSVVTISGVNNKEVYSVERLDGFVTVEFSLTQDYEKVTLQYVQGEGEEISLRTITDSSDNYVYTLAGGQNINEGVNKYVIRGYDKEGEQEVLSTIDLYYLQLPSQGVSGSFSGADGINGETIKILYFRTPHTDFLVNRMKDILALQQIYSYFTFIGYEFVDEFESKIASKDYDVVIRSVDLGFKKDFSTILLTDDPRVNPSLYVNTRLASLVSDYIHADSYEEKVTIKGKIDEIYGTDMPFVVIGSIYSSLFVNESMPYVHTGQFDVSTIKQQIVDTVVFSEHVQLDGARLYNSETFTDYLTSIFLGE